MVYKNKVQKESPKEKKIQNGKLLLRKRKRKGEMKKEKKICRKIKGWRRIELGCLITKAYAKEMSFKVLDLSCEALGTFDFPFPSFHANP